MLYINLGHGLVFKIHILASEYNILALFVAARLHNVIIRREFNWWHNYKTHETSKTYTWFATFIVLISNLERLISFNIIYWFTTTILNILWRMTTNLTNVTYVTCCAMYLYQSSKFEISMYSFQYALTFVSGKWSVLKKYIGGKVKMFAENLNSLQSTWFNSVKFTHMALWCVRNEYIKKYC